IDMIYRWRPWRILGLFAISLLLLACEGSSGKNVWPGKRQPGQAGPVYSEPVRETVFGPGGLQLGGTRRDDDPGGAGIGVNAFLWRASLDTFAFMPLSSADPFGGVIITDWYAPPS